MIYFRDNYWRQVPPSWYLGQRFLASIVWLSQCFHFISYSQDSIYLSFIRSFLGCVFVGGGGGHVWNHVNWCKLYCHAAVVSLGHGIRKHTRKKYITSLLVLSYSALALRLYALWLIPTTVIFSLVRETLMWSLPSLFLFFIPRFPFFLFLHRRTWGHWIHQRYP